MNSQRFRALAILFWCLINLGVYAFVIWLLTRIGVLSDFLSGLRQNAWILLLLAGINIYDRFQTGEMALRDLGGAMRDAVTRARRLADDDSSTPRR
jgi:hypothetical protein